MSDKIKTQLIDIKTPDGICDTFIAYPDNNEKNTAILFLMDGIGPRDHLYEMAKTMALRGYYVLLPNMFYRLKKAPFINMKFPLGPNDMPELSKQIMPLFQSYKPEFGIKDAAVFFDFLSQQNQVKAGAIGIAGYCFGAGLAIRIAAHYPDRVAALACFHGARLATEAPDSPHQLLGQIKCELYIAHADNDQNNTADQIELFRKSSEQSGVRYEAETYKGAAHGFTMADLPAYNEVALKRHWEKLFKLFERSFKTN